MNKPLFYTTMRSKVTLEHPAKFGMDKAAYRGFFKSREAFFAHCTEQAIIGNKGRFVKIFYYPY